jgi:hypothetical protein
MRAVRALIIFLVGAIASLAVTYMVVLRPRIKTWGVDPIETEAALPGDELITEPMATETRGVTIDAPVSQVWPWLVQMGMGRAGWYSFESMDKRNKSADSILPQFQKLEPGEIMPIYNGGGFEVRTVDPQSALVLFTDTAMISKQAKDAGLVTQEQLEQAQPKRGQFGRGSYPDFSASWAFILKPTDDGQTRLIERFRVKAESKMPANAVMQELMSTGIVLMARKQMLGIKERAERPQATETMPATNGTGNGNGNGELSGSHDPQIEIPDLGAGGVVAPN